MYVIIAPIQIKHDFKEQFIEAMILDAKGLRRKRTRLPPLRHHPGRRPLRPHLALRSLQGRSRLHRTHQDPPHQEVARNHQRLARRRPLRRRTRQPHHLAPRRTLQITPTHFPFFPLSQTFPSFPPTPPSFPRRRESIFSLLRRGNPLCLPYPSAHPEPVEGSSVPPMPFSVIPAKAGIHLLPPP